LIDEGAFMAIGWIDKVLNKTDKLWYIKSKNDINNGIVESAHLKLQLDDCRFHVLDPRTTYEGEWCGIPLDAKGLHYKEFATNKQSGIALYVMQTKQGAWVEFKSTRTEKILARQDLPLGKEFHCHIRIETNGFYVDILNATGDVISHASTYRYNEENQSWVPDTIDAVAAALKQAA
tara:strand:+ start:730 stop:1260 length:531 start_codon:yes stop_codon:yes gene_type:complete